MTRPPSYEADRVDARRLAWIGTIFVLVLAAVLALMYLLWHPLSPAPTTRTVVPPAPRLQAEPRRDLLATRQAQRDRLQAYGWSDPAHRYAQVPIDRAMAVMAEHAAPAGGGDHP